LPRRKEKGPASHQKVQKKEQAALKGGVISRLASESKENDQRAQRKQGEGVETKRKKGRS